MLIDMRKSLKSQKGFTLIELLAVIAVIGILAAIAIPNMTTSTASARGARIVADLRTIDSAIAITLAQGTAVAASATVPVAVAANLAATPTPPTGDARGPSGTTRTVAAATTYGTADVGGSIRAIIAIGATNFVAETF